MNATSLSPAEALERLMAGNERFATGRSESPRRGLDRVRELGSGQAPYAAILGCADSRVPPEILFDEGLGDVFTVRVAGNVASLQEIASLEFAVAVLGVRVVLVLGHRFCGAVTAAIEGQPVPSLVSALFDLMPAVPDGAGIDDAVVANARYQAHVLRTSSRVVREALRAGSILVRSAIYDLEDGRVTLLP
jgi:carbonic anhydrase